MATHQQVLELAKQGNPNAIALLITNSLKAQGIIAKANRKGDCLQVMLESSQIPDQLAMVPLIRQGMMKLEILSIKTVKVYGKQANLSMPAWSQHIDLINASVPLSYQPKPALPSPSSTKFSVPSHPQFHTFQYSFFASSVMFISMIPFSIIAYLLLLTLWRGITAYFLIVIALLNMLFTIAIVLYFRVYISPTGINSYDLFGKYYFVEWSSITAVRLYNLLGFKSLLVSSTQSAKTLWVPLFLADRLRFIRLVSKYAGVEHLLTQRLQRNGNYSSPLEEANGQIKAGWLAACVVGGVTLFLVVDSLFSYNPYGSVSLWNLIDVALIFGLAFGIYKKSRLAAVAMLVYDVLSRITAWITLGHISFVSFLASIVFIGCFVEGIRGTFTYHRVINSQR